MKYLQGINVPLESLIVFVPIDTLVRCLRVCKQWSIMLRPLLEEKIEMLPWRFTIEYHEDIIDNIPRVVFHQAWIKIGIFDRNDIRSIEICEYCYIKRKSESIPGNWNVPLDFDSVRILIFDNSSELKLSIRELLRCCYSGVTFSLTPRDGIYYPCNIRQVSCDNYGQNTKMKASIQIGDVSPHPGGSFDILDIYRFFIPNEFHKRGKCRKVMTTNIEKLSQFKGFFSHF